MNRDDYSLKSAILIWRRGEMIDCAHWVRLTNLGLNVPALERVHYL